MARRPVSLALQGGRSWGAYASGVLDALLASRSRDCAARRHKRRGDQRGYRGRRLGEGIASERQTGVALILDVGCGSCFGFVARGFCATLLRPCGGPRTRTAQALAVPCLGGFNGLQADQRPSLRGAAARTSRWASSAECLPVPVAGPGARHHRRIARAVTTRSGRTTRWAALPPARDRERLLAGQFQFRPVYWTRSLRDSPWNVAYEVMFKVDFRGSRGSSRDVGD